MDQYLAQNIVFSIQNDIDKQLKIHSYAIMKVLRNKNLYHIKRQLSHAPKKWS